MQRMPRRQRRGGGRWLQTVTTTLEEVLLEECREAGAACPAPWGTMERLSPLLYTWAQVGKCCILLL